MREGKWHSSRPRKLHNMERNRFAIVQHHGQIPAHGNLFPFNEAKQDYQFRFAGKLLLSSADVRQCLVQESHKGSNQGVIKTVEQMPNGSYSPPFLPV